MSGPLVPPAVAAARLDTLSAAALPFAAALPCADVCGGYVPAPIQPALLPRVAVSCALHELAEELREAMIGPSLAASATPPCSRGRRRRRPQRTQCTFAIARSEGGTEATCANLPPAAWERLDAKEMCHLPPTMQKVPGFLCALSRVSSRWLDSGEAVDEATRLHQYATQARSGG